MATKTQKQVRELLVGQNINGNVIDFKEGAFICGKRKVEMPYHRRIDEPAFTTLVQRLGGRKAALNLGSGKG